MPEFRTLNLKITDDGLGFLEGCGLGLGFLEAVSYTHLTLPTRRTV